MSVERRGVQKIGYGMNMPEQSPPTPVASLREGVSPKHNTVRIYINHDLP